MSGVRALFVGDFDGTGAERDGLIIGRDTSFSSLRNTVRPGYLSIPSVVTATQPLSLQQNAVATLFAAGDYSGDGRFDVVAEGAGGLQRYLGAGFGTFTADGPVFGSGATAIGMHGRTLFAVVGGTRLRVYDPTCTVAPAGFPANETFGVNGLCASVPGVFNVIVGPRFMTLGARTFMVLVTRLNSISTLRAFELLRVGGSITLAARATHSIGAGFVTDLDATGSTVVWGQDDGAVAARTFNGTAWSTIAAMPATVVRPGNPDPITHVKVGTFAGRTAVVAVGTKDAMVYVVPFQLSTGWDLKSSVAKSYGSAGQLPMGLALGQFNDDNLTDIAVLNGTAQKYVIIRQQPPPCATYIVSASHGLQGFLGLPAIVAPPTPPRPVFESAGFNKLLSGRVDKINDSRRPASGFRDIGTIPEQCPVRFIDVRGNWETMSAEGIQPAYGARAVWVASMLVPFPAFTPIDYWAEFILPPVIAVRGSMATIAYSLQAAGESIANTNVLVAANQLNGAVRTAIADADARMNACTGSIFVDLIGQSRGTAMLTQTLRRTLGPRSRFNFEVSTTLLDAVDKSGPSEWLPHIRGGYIVGDPPITRVGSEWNSNFYGDRADDTIGALEGLMGIVPPFVGSTEHRRSVVIGLPKGRPGRQSELEDPARTFDSYRGPILTLHHGEFFRAPTGGFTANSTGDGDMNGELDNFIDAPSAAIAAEDPSFDRFAFIHTTHLGALMKNPRAAIADAYGFDKNPTIAMNNEATCRPSQCGGTPTNCPNFLPAPIIAADEEHQGELVNDYDHRKKAGVLKAAQEIQTNDPEFKNTMPNVEFATLRSYLVTTTNALWPDGLGWRRTAGAITVTPAASSVPDNVNPLVRFPGVNYATFTPAQWTAAEAQLKTELTGLSANQLTDRTESLAVAAARMMTAEQPSLVFPSTGVQRVETTLLATSTDNNRLWVRIEFQTTTAAATMRVDVNGPGVARTVSWTGATGTNQRIAEFIINRTATTALGPDIVTLTGNAARVFAISVRAVTPWESAVNTSSYEFVRLDEGVSYDRAYSLAKRHMYKGQIGRLMTNITPALLTELSTKLPGNSIGLVDARSSTGASGSFVGYNGIAVPTAAFLTGTRFTVARPRGAWAFTWPSSLGTKLGHGHPGVAMNTRNLGFWVEYPNTSSVAPAAAAMAPGSFEDLSSWMMSVFAEQTTTAGIEDTTSIEAFPLPPPPADSDAIEPSGPPACDSATASCPTL